MLYIIDEKFTKKEAIVLAIDEPRAVLVDKNAFNMVNFESIPGREVKVKAYRAEKDQSKLTKYMLEQAVKLGAEKA